MLEQEWIVACRAVDLTEKPMKVMIMGEPIVIFRNDSGVHAMKDLCIHRGAPLSLGCVKNGNIMCPYHGWEYNQKGMCVKIPQLTTDTIPVKAKVTVYGCQEQLGFIWVNLGNNQPVAIPLPEFHDDSYHHITWGPQEVDAMPPRIIENFLDVGHLSFIHEDFLGTADYTEIDDYKMIEEGDRLYSEEIKIFQPNADGSGIPKHVFYTYEILRPLTVRFTKRNPENDQKMSILLTVQPVTQNKSIAYGVMLFNYDTGTTDEEAIAFQNLIFSQDKPIVENQKPELLPLDLQAELSLKCDRVSIAYRKYLAQLGVTYGTA